PIYMKAIRRWRFMKRSSGRRRRNRSCKSVAWTSRPLRRPYSGRRERQIIFVKEKSGDGVHPGGTVCWEESGRGMYPSAAAGNFATVVKAVRDRHDGRKRNPWNEAEFGHHYARSMSSWSLLTALSGFR